MCLAQFAERIGAARKAVVYQWEARAVSLSGVLAPDSETCERAGLKGRFWHDGTHLRIPAHRERRFRSNLNAESDGW